MLAEVDQLALCDLETALCPPTVLVKPQNQQ